MARYSQRPENALKRANGWFYILNTFCLCLMSFLIFVFDTFLYIL